MHITAFEALSLHTVKQLHVSTCKIVTLKRQWENQMLQIVMQNKLVSMLSVRLGGRPWSVPAWLDVGIETEVQTCCVYYGSINSSKLLLVMLLTTKLPKRTSDWKVENAK